MLCAPIESNYCHESWTNCTKNRTNPTLCSKENCQNVIKSVRYVIKHNGTLGINDIQLYFLEANVTGKFYQNFQVIFEWFNDDRNKSYQRSGNPGYTAGNPIFIATLMTNNSSQNVGTKNIFFDKNNKYLTLPIANSKGECDDIKKYTVNFGENIKLKCKFILKSKYFSSSTCAELQNKIFHLMLKKTFLNLTDINNSNKLQISRSGNIIDRNHSNWIDVFYNQLPKQMANGRLLDEKISCSGLITSMRIDVVHSILSKPEFIDNHVILGFGVTFSNLTTITWTKCKTINCIDNLNVNIINYVTFHDASKPSKIYFASGPNLDISLPYDFFYPFLSNSKGITIYLNNFLLYCLFIALIISW